MLLQYVVISWSALALNAAPCPASCVSANSLEAAQVEHARVTCDGEAQLIRVALDFGDGHVVERNLPLTAEGCRSVPEVLRLLSKPLVPSRDRVHALTETTRKTRPNDAGVHEVDSPAPRVGDPSASSSETSTPDITQASIRSPPKRPPNTSARSSSARPAQTTPEPLADSAEKASNTDDVNAPRTLDSPQQPSDTRRDESTTEAPTSARRAVDTSHLHLAIDVGAGVHLAPLAPIFRIRVALAPWLHVGFLAEGAATTSITTRFDTGTAMTEAQHAQLGTLFSLFGHARTGPQVALLAGAEHVAAHQTLTDQGWGFIASAKLEWFQPITHSLYLRVSAGADVRPTPWSLQAGGVTQPMWGQVSGVATVSIGFAPSIL